MRDNLLYGHKACLKSEMSHDVRIEWCFGSFGCACSPHDFQLNFLTISHLVSESHILVAEKRVSNFGSVSVQASRLFVGDFTHHGRKFDEENHEIICRWCIVIPHDSFHQTFHP